MLLIPYTELQNIEVDKDSFDLPTGFPSPAMDFMEQRINLKKLLVRRPLSTFFGFNEGDYLVDIGIMPGSILVIDKSVNYKSGDTIVLFMEGEYYVRIFELFRLKPRLVAANRKKNYAPIELTEEMEGIVWGTVIDVVTHFKNVE